MTKRLQTVANGHQVQVTENHPFWSGGDWVAAEDIADGAEVVIADDRGAVIRYPPRVAIGFLFPIRKKYLVYV